VGGGAAGDVGGREADRVNDGPASVGRILPERFSSTLRRRPRHEQDDGARRLDSGALSHSIAKRPLGVESVATVRSVFASSPAPALCLECLVKRTTLRVAQIEQELDALGASLREGFCAGCAKTVIAHPGTQRRFAMIR
jgi:hypothetical protein